MLLNVTKIRYAEPPFFLDVQQIVTQYSFEVGGSITAPHWNGEIGDSAANASGRRAESPTITYNPMTGRSYIKTLIQPIDPAELLGLAESGWPIDVLFSITVRSINGLQAVSHRLNRMEPGNPDFYRLLTLLRQLQDSGAISLRVESADSVQDNAKGESGSSGKEDGENEKETKTPIRHGLMVLRSRPLTESERHASQEVRRLLRLNPDAREFTLVYGGTSKNDREVSMLTRSMLGILIEASVGVDVPPSDIQEGRAARMEPGDEAGVPRFFLLHVHSSESKPPVEDVFALVHNRRK